MIGQDVVQIDDLDDVIAEEADNSFIPLSDPDTTTAELEAVDADCGPRGFRLDLPPKPSRLRSRSILGGNTRSLCERHDGSLDYPLVLWDWPRAGGNRFPLFVPGNRPCDQPVGRNAGVRRYRLLGWHTGCREAEAKITEKTRAIVACNNNGHPAAWAPLRAVAKAHGLILIEDSTEAIGSKYQGALVGTFGDAAIFDFSQPSPLTCGEGAWW